MRLKGTRNGAMAIGLAAVIVGMLGLTAASVPLYRLFCAATGYNGTPRIATEASSTVRPVEIQVSFNTDTDQKLPWTFRPMQRAVTVKLGEEHLAFFEAINRSKHPVVGHAIFNVAPDKIASYFAKLECFCFTEQTLQPGERVEMPVSFFVDPALMDDINAHEVRQITLSYTFYLDEAATAALVRKQQGQSSAG